jgi:phosphoserine phosphatase RsbU/P
MEDDAEDLYEHAPCGFLSARPDGTIVRANQTFLDWIGYDRGDLLERRRFQELLAPGARIYHETHYAPLLRMQGSVREIAVDFVHRDGRRLPALVNSVLKRDEAGQPAVIRTTVFEANDRRAYEQELLRARQRAEESEARARQLARTLQETLIPAAPPRIPHLDVAGCYRPAGRGDEVGGDFYDVFEVETADWAIVLGDVMGKGAEAAVVTALVRHATRAAAVSVRQPAMVLRTLNAALRDHATDRFCTAAYARVRPRAHSATVTLASAGHPLPLLVRAGEEPRPVASTGTLLGVLPELDIEDAAVELHRGDAVVLFSDGVTEARRGGEFYGDDRLVRSAAAAAGSTASDLAEHIVAEVLDFQDGFPRDDIAVVVLRVPEQDPVA